MKTKFLITLLSAATLFGAASIAQAQSSKSQAGGLPALAEEVAALRAMVLDLQQQIGGSADPYSGTYAVTIVETGLFGCRMIDPPAPPPTYVQPFFGPLLPSSVAVRSASLEAEADGSTLVIPEFVMLSQELKLSGYYQPYTNPSEGELQLTIGGDGSFTYQFDDSVLEGQFSRDGSLFSALVVGRALDKPSTVGCEDVWTAHVLGVKK